jgi:hypothetical protein
MYSHYGWHVSEAIKGLSSQRLATTRSVRFVSNFGPINTCHLVFYSKETTLIPNLLSPSESICSTPSYLPRHFVLVAVPLQRYIVDIYSGKHPRDSFGICTENTVISPGAQNLALPTENA